MKITRENYESFFLDYLEGNLEENMIDQFLDFLEQHPDLKQELSLFEDTRLLAEPVVFPGKQTLYRSASTNSFDEKAVAYMEGDLDQEESKAFEASLSGLPLLQKEWALFEKTRLIPDSNIRFPGKGKLYRRPAAVVWISWIGRAAAIVILLLGIRVLFQNGEESRLAVEPVKMASVKDPASNQPRETAPIVNQPLGQAVAPTAKKAKQSALPASTGRVNLPQVQPQRRQDNQREAVSMEQLATIFPRLESVPEEIALVPFNRSNNQRINNGYTVLTLDEYLALKAKKATNEGLLSANRLLRIGLNVASEISGERLGYTVKNGKVASLDFESKLLAFEIPLEKK